MSEYVPKILAFLQNPWFRPGTDMRHVIAYRDNQGFHQRVLAASMSGRRLVQTFGETTYRLIHWSNANWRPTWVPYGLMDADYPYMKQVAEEVDPKLILCFGTVATIAARHMLFKREIWSCKHPNARHFPHQELEEFANKVNTWIQNERQSYLALQAQAKPLVLCR